MDAFEWGNPKENWSKLPHAFIAALPRIETLAEIKVILYVLRHTWGFQDDYKHITMDEFVNGRQKRNGDRIDNGVGMSKNSIRDGIDRAILHGLLFAWEDATDKARIKRYFALTEPYSIEQLEVQKLTPRGSEVAPQRFNNCTPEVQKLTPRGSEVDPRTKKETLERNFRKKPLETGSPSAMVVDRGSVFELWQNNMPGSLTPIIAEQIDDFIDTYGVLEVETAINLAVKANKRNARYIQGILVKRAAGDEPRKPTPATPAYVSPLAGMYIYNPADNEDA